MAYYIVGIRNDFFGHLSTADIAKKEKKMKRLVVISGMVFVLLTILLSPVVESTDADLNWPENTMYNPDYTWYTQQKNLSCMTLGTDRRTIATTGAYEDHGIGLYDIEGHFIAQLPAHAKSVWCATFSPDGAYIFSGGDDKTIEQWSISKREKITTYAGHKDSVESVDISPSGQIMASSGGCSGAIRIWDTRTKQLIKILGEEKVNDNFLPWVGPIKFLNDNELVAGYNDGLKVWDVSRKTYSFLYGGHRSVHSLALSPDKSFLASGSSRDGSLCIWDLRTKTLEKILNTPGGAIYSLAFVSKNIIVAGRYHTADLYNWSTGQNLLELRDHGGPVVSVIVTSQNILTASGYPEGAVRIWDISKIVPTLQPQSIIVWSRIKSQ